MWTNIFLSNFLVNECVWSNPKCEFSESDKSVFGHALWILSNDWLNEWEFFSCYYMLK